MSGQVFTTRRIVRFGQCDAAGIVFFPRYFEMLNETIEDWFAEGLGVSFGDIHQVEGRSVPTAALQARFAHPSRLEDRLEFALTVERIGRTSCTLRHTVRCGDDLRFECGQTLVNVGRDLRPEPWPEPMRDRMQTYLETPA